MIDLEQIKSEWQSLKIQNEALKQKNIDLINRLNTQRITSAQQRLSTNYRTGYLGLCFPFIALLIYFDLKCPVSYCIAYAIFGLILGAFDLWFMSFIKSIDYSAVPTVKALSHASKVVRYQNYATILSLTLTVIMLYPLFHHFVRIGEYSLLSGGVVGGIIGGAVGARICYVNHRLARRIKADLQSID